MVRLPGIEFPTTFELERSSRFPTAADSDAIAGSVAGIHHSTRQQTLTGHPTKYGFKDFPRARLSQRQ